MSTQKACPANSANANFYELRMGYTTGTCAAAAAKAAALVFLGHEPPSEVELLLPSGVTCTLPIHSVVREPNRVVACVKKNAGDDPDVTHGLFIFISLSPIAGNTSQFVAGDGVGTVTLPGLALPPGEPAINPTPRGQILQALREVTDLAFVIRVSIPGGVEIAKKTFNPRLGIQGGLSILGTDGQVRPLSHERRLAAVLLGLDVAHAMGTDLLVLVPGHQGRRQAIVQLNCPAHSIVEAGNDFAPMLSRCCELGLTNVLLLGHPGKLAKLADGELDTHSSRSRSAICSMSSAARALGIAIDARASTTEALLLTLSDAEQRALSELVALRIRERVSTLYSQLTVGVRLNNLAGKVLATVGDIRPWLKPLMNSPS